MIKKIQIDERHLSHQLAEPTVTDLAITTNERSRFVAAPHAGRAADTLSLAPAPTHPAPTFLPPPATRLIGRDRDLRALGAQLADPTSRLITIAGPGGVGKTRLALAVAAAEASAFADGVYSVQLAPVRDPALVLAALAQALDMPRNDAVPLDELVHETLARRHLLLLLDNCEHLLPALTTLIASLLAAAPQLVVLATSRVALNLSQERRYLLAPLSLPDESQPVEAQFDSAAVALFVERAQAVRPLAEQELAAIGTICRRLDGLPLAIELAATRTRLLSTHELLTRLDQRLALISGGPRDLPERHQGLHATIEWSYQLLGLYQQALFRRLAVFADGWSAAAAEAVCADLQHTAPAAAPILDGLTALLDASLIVASTNGVGEPRCTMLETIREYALIQLAAHGELEHAQAEHARYVATLADTAKSALTSADGEIWTARLQAEHGNLSVALRWAIDQDDPETALRIGRGVWRFWWRGGYVREGLNWLTLGLLSEQEVDCQIRAEALRAAGVLAYAIADYPQAHRWLAQGLDLARKLPDRHPEATIYTMLGILARAEGAFARAYTYFGASHAISVTLDDRYERRFAIMGMAEIDTRLGQLDDAAERYTRCIALNNAAGDAEGIAAAKRRLAHVYVLQQRNYAEAETLCAESMALCRAIGDQQGMGQTHFVFGNIARDQGDTALAVAHYHESLRLRALLEHYEECAQTLEALAVSLGDIQQDQRAVQLISGARHIRTILRCPLTAFEQSMLDEEAAAWRDRLGGDQFDDLWRRGEALTFDQLTQLAHSAGPTLAETPTASQPSAIPNELPRIDGHRAIGRARLGSGALATALAEHMAGPADTTIAQARTQHRAGLDAATLAQQQHLTAREREILHLMVAGMTNPQIAERLVIGAGTVKTHTLNIYRKLEVANRTQAIVRAQELGLLRI
jgi:non-specific serine/threonine protein kinase